MRRYREADAWFSRALAIDQNHRRTRTRKARNYILWKGQTQEAKQSLANMHQDAETLAMWRFIHRNDRDYPAILTQLDSLSYDSWAHTGTNFERHPARANAYYLLKRGSVYASTR